MHLSKLTIKQKLYFAFLFMAAVTFVVAFMCASNLSSNINAVFDTKTTLAKNLVVVSNVQQTMSELDGAVSACATDPVSNKAKADSLSMLVTDFKSAMNNFSFKEYKDDVARITAAANEYVSGVSKIADFAKNGDTAAAKFYADNMVNQRIVVTTGLVKINASMVSHCSEAVEQISGRGTVYLAYVLAVLTVIFALYISAQISSSIQHTLRIATKAANAIARGDLTEEIEGNYDNELGELLSSLDMMRRRWQALVKNMQSTIYSVEGNVRSVSMITDKVTEGAGVAQSRSMSVSAAANQMVNNTSDIARNCVQASESASVASDITNSSVAQISQTINGIQDQVNKSKDDAELVRALVEQAQKIGNIVNTIEDIANQTNLLALNAAIEAARAGTYGKGFAVVADEVRALASRTSKSTSEITSMVKQIQSDANSANATLQRSLVRMNELAGAAADVESHLQTIQEHVGSAAEQITQIATAANEQTSATSEISDNINQIKDIIEGFNVEVDSSHQEISASVRQLDTLLAQVKKITV